MTPEPAKELIVIRSPDNSPQGTPACRGARWTRTFESLSVSAGEVIERIQRSQLVERGLPENPGSRGRQALRYIILTLEQVSFSPGGVGIP